MIFVRFSCKVIPRPSAQVQAHHRRRRHGRALRSSGTRKKTRPSARHLPGLPKGNGGFQLGKWGYPHDELETPKCTPKKNEKKIQMDSNQVGVDCLCGHDNPQVDTIHCLNKRLQKKKVTQRTTKKVKKHIETGYQLKVENIMNIAVDSFQHATVCGRASLMSKRRLR